MGGRAPSPKSLENLFPKRVLGSKVKPWSVSVADRFYARIVRALGGHARSFLLRDSAPAGLGAAPHQPKAEADSRDPSCQQKL